MREDQQEALDKLFPEGYLILYGTESKDLRLSLHNPHGYAVFPEFMDAVNRHKHESEGRDMPTVISQIVNQLQSSEPAMVRLQNIKAIIEGQHGEG